MSISTLDFGFLPGYDKSLERLEQATRAQLCSKHFWAHTVEQGLLPTLLDLAGLAEDLWQALQGMQEEARQQLQAQKDITFANALAIHTIRPCANLLCTNVQGCSEGWLRGRRCGGCKVVRYCSRECQLQHWSQHGPVCVLLAT